MKADVFRARARNYPSAREAALFHDDVPVSVYDNLIATVRAQPRPALPLLRAAPARARARRNPPLRHLRADRRTTSRPTCRGTTPCDKVLAALAPLGDEYCRTLGDGLRGPLVRSLRKQGQAQRRVQLVELRQSAVHPDELQARRLLRRLHARARGRPLACTPGMRSARSPSRLTTTRSSSRKSPAPSTKSCSPIISSTRRATRGCAPTSSTARSTTSAARSIRQTMFAEFEKIIHAMEEAGEPLTLDTFRADLSRPARRLLRPGLRHRRRAGARVPAHPAFLQRLLRLQIRHRHQRRGRALAAGAATAATPTRYLGFLQLRRLEVSASRRCRTPAWTCRAPRRSRPRCALRPARGGAGGICSA